MHCVPQTTIDEDIKTLEKVRDLIQQGWTKAAFARNEAGDQVDPTSQEACSWCLLGALQCALNVSESYQVIRKAPRVIFASDNVLKERFPQFVSMISLNDYRLTTKSDVIDFLNLAIAKLQKEKQDHDQLKQFEQSGQPE